MSAFVYIEARVDGGYASDAREAFQTAVLDLGLHGRGPSLRFFRRQSARDRDLDTWSERLPSRIAIDGCAFPDRNDGRGEIWVSTALTHERLVEVVEHEVLHIAKRETHVSEAMAEAAAEAYVNRSRMSLVAELYGRRAS